MRVVGYVHELFRMLACCDLAVVQGGLTTTMELVANRRPFVYCRYAATSSKTATSLPAPTLRRARADTVRAYVARGSSPS